MAKYVPLEFGLIGEGAFLKDVDYQLKKIQKQLINYINQFGKDNKVAAGLDIKVQFLYIPDHNAFAMKASMKSNLPSMPGFIAALIPGETQTGEPALLCAAAGTSDDSPLQQRFCTQDGRRVDPETGEVIDEQEPDDCSPVEHLDRSTC
jgi:hypothetical protein